MKKITTTMGKFGPYNTVEILENRYEVDGAHLPFTVVGTGVIEDWTDEDTVAVPVYQDPEVYKYQRADAYPSFADQFDLIYHRGIDAWKTAIQAVKDKYPKPSPEPSPKPTPEEPVVYPTEYIINAQS